MLEFENSAMVILFVVITIALYLKKQLIGALNIRVN